MKRTKSTWMSCVIAGLLLLAPALASAQKITTDSDQTATFTGYTTYTVEGTGAGGRESVDGAARGSRD
jgi:uncharacterized membrane protein